MYNINNYFKTIICLFMSIYVYDQLHFNFIQYTSDSEVFYVTLIFLIYKLLTQSQYQPINDSINKRSLSFENGEKRL